MLKPACWSLVLLLAACVEDVQRSRPPGDTSDAAVDSDIPECDSPQQFFADRDGDGFGDPNMPITACAQPAAAVTNKDDCNDIAADVHPGVTEICDAIDNDCNTTTLEACPAGCQVMRRPPPDDDDHAYLFCSAVLNWPNARTSCANAGFTLVEIDSAEENVFVRTTATTLLGTGPIHIGANDIAVLGQFVWEGGALFWIGGANGQPQNGAFAAWAPQEPNGSDRCVEVRTDNGWYDNVCGDGQRFVCRR